MKCEWRASLLIPLLLVAAVPALAGCGGGSADETTAPDVTPPGSRSDTARIPLTDLGTGTYKGFTGGLYPNGSNLPPAVHAAGGLTQARLIQALDVQGRPSASGKYVLLSIGMSNVTQEFCAEAGTVCNPWTFSGKAAVDPAVNHTTLAIANGARGGQTADVWDSPDEANYVRVRDQVLTPAGLSEAQVQIVWLGAVLATPTVALPDPSADAYNLERALGAVVRALKVRYPNLRQIFLSSRTYAGFATTNLNPEPYAYETGFAMKFLIEAQIRQIESGAIDARAGNLGPAQAAWLGWAAYFWAGDSSHPRADGFFWVRQDFEADGTHESQTGEEKAARLLLEFFKTSPQARCWFLAGLTC
jgi:hypothetical protein